MTVVIGIAIGVVGWLGTDRRFTTWGGGAIASVGAFIVAADVAPNPGSSVDNPDLIGTGFVVIAFGLAVIGLAWAAGARARVPPVLATAERATSRTPAAPRSRTRGRRAHNP